MAKHGKGGVRPAKIDHSIAVGALVVTDVVATAHTGVVDKPEFLLSCDIQASAREFTAGEGPILFGIAHSDYSAAEIEEYLENEASWATSDLIARERAGRKIRTIGTFSLLAAEEVLNDGKAVRIKCRWMLADGQGIQTWVWNQGPATLTTGGVVEMKGMGWLKR